MRCNRRGLRNTVAASWCTKPHGNTKRTATRTATRFSAKVHRAEWAEQLTLNLIRYERTLVHQVALSCKRKGLAIRTSAAKRSKTHGISKRTDTRTDTRRLTDVKGIWDSFLFADHTSKYNSLEMSCGQPRIGSCSYNSRQSIR